MSSIQVNAHIAFFQLSFMESLHVFRNKLRYVRNRLFGIAMSIHSLDEMSDFICRHPFFIKVNDKLFQHILDRLEGAIVCCWNWPLRSLGIRRCSSPYSV